MGRYLAADGKDRGPLRLAIFLLATMAAVSTPGTLHAQGPPLTTISEVRYSDMGWGTGNAGNLVGRFTTSSFTLSRFSRAQTYFLKSYDNSSPARYSRYPTSLHVDYPLS